MTMTELAMVVGLLIALSMASERIVEIVKNLVPFLNQESKDPEKEGQRRAALQTLAVVAGIVTALLARPTIPRGLLDATDGTAVVALGLLASGGAGFWNAILTWFLRVKDAKEKELGIKK